VRRFFIFSFCSFIFYFLKGVVFMSGKDPYFGEGGPATRGFGGLAQQSQFSSSNWNLSGQSTSHMTLSRPGNCNKIAVKCPHCSPRKNNPPPRLISRDHIGQVVACDERDCNGKYIVPEEDGVAAPAAA
jgi:hypothetical protein